MANTNRNPGVVVIGGGAVGLSIADALSREGISVSVLERGHCGREASWAGAGILQCGSWHRRDPLVQLQRESVAMYADFVADLCERTGIDCQYDRCGGLELLLEDQQLRMARSEVKATACVEQEDGHRVLELLTPEQARQLEPAITQDLLAAKRCAVTGQVRNPRLLKALYEACRRGGVEIVEQCDIKGLITKGDRVIGVRTEAGTRQASHVVLAAGCWSSLLDERLGQQMPVVPVRGQVVLLRMAEPIFRHVIGRGRCYLVPRNDGHVVVGATHEPEAGYEKITTAGGISSLLAAAIRLVPGLSEATMVQTWVGLRPGTPDGRPYIGPVPGLPGLIAATGHFRSGLTLVPITACVVADLIIRGRTDRDLSRCQPGRLLENRIAAQAGA